ncbi:MbtH family NRPS accessory protein [Streptomyces sp. NBC_00096]|uniref:MbtH family NRPS accessory protein n=1 Tax=Streptomyces sp. NBC_00096 TaxID=2975650 RepID=UPI0032464ACE
MFEDDDGRAYRIVHNEKGNHSLWPADRPAPDGWYPTGFLGPKRICLDHLSAVLGPAPAHPGAPGGPR